MRTSGFTLAVDVAAFLPEAKGATGVKDGNSRTGRLPPLRCSQLLSRASVGLTWALVVACGALLQPPAASAKVITVNAGQSSCLETGSGMSGHGCAGGPMQQRALLQESGGGGSRSSAVQLSAGALAGVVIGAVAFGLVASWLASLLLRSGACFWATERLLACLPTGLAKGLRMHVHVSGSGGGRSSSHRRGSDGSGRSGSSSSRGGGGGAACDGGGVVASEVCAGSSGVEMAGAARALAAGLGLGLQRGSVAVRKRAVAPGCCQELFGREVTLVATDGGSGAGVLGRGLGDEGRELDVWGWCVVHVLWCAILEALGRACCS